MAKGWNSQSKTKSRARGPKVRVKTARGRTVSSTRWLERQLNDPYVAEANRLGYRSRAAFKLLELDERFKVLDGAKRIVDLGCAPGGWTQVVMQKFKGQVPLLGIDLQEVEPIPGATFVQMDFLEEGADEKVRSYLDGAPNIVLSDMANSATGHRRTDQVRTMMLAEAALEFAIDNLEEGGTFVAKVLQGGADNDLMVRMKKHFRTVKHAKPPSSRQDSKEWFVVAQGFRKLSPAEAAAESDRESAE
ncbi:RlmE family RNA methyltransferase [Pseudokordiimonas caeni]|uniref:RlmE family RNA methyltransferase n=1 Tax=Pseudokordiimonas caeni TaxID=2997908 RepID=UPI002810C828|nr:RlmE family RNA methyltransferase [Pseudokordiimonas caeni]